ncbi:MAG: NAD(P)/FAD-dependent oxidoreductase [Atopobiaceae bacterium]|nr:NAD(P)/FAD-dependent oxidoreductase [Atopobiaceae bacterium]
MKLKKLQRALRELDPGIEAHEKDGCIQLTGEVDDYATVFAAGKLAVDKKRYLGVLNDIVVRGAERQPVLPGINDDKYDGLHCDVLVVGGGITGCAIARELRRHELSVIVCEKGPDVASGQSSRNGGVVHVGVNFSKDSLKLKYCVRGNAMYRKLAHELHVPYENKGQVTFARTRLEMLALEYVHRTALEKGVVGTKVMSRDELRQIEPSVPDWSVGGLFMATGGITSPYQMTIALAENAVENGATIALNTAVLDMEVSEGLVTKVVTNRGCIHPKAVVNAAGVYADVIAQMADDRTFTIHPRVGTNIVTDKKAGWMVNTSMGKTPFTLTPNQLENIPRDPISFVKATLKSAKSHTKGIALIHTVDGNMLVGPHADEVMDREDTSTDRATVERILKNQQEVQPALKASDVIAYFTGVRSPTYEEDFVVRSGIRTRNVFEAAGIQSPGLTAAPALAVDIAVWVRTYLSSVMKIMPNDSFDPVRKCRPVLRELSCEERDRLIRDNPDYGQIVCRCEEISKGEILDVLRSPLPVFTVDGVKRRTRPGMGRCQGSFCLPAVMRIIADEAGIPFEEVVKAGSRSTIVYGATHART